MISVILPVYNVEKYLEECLCSLQKQSCDLQVIIVDDGSSDSSFEIAKKYVQDFPEVFECHQKKNGGVSDARNYGVSYVKGEYIWFIDSDDYIPGNAVEMIESAIKKFDPDLLFFNYIEVYNDYVKSYKVVEGETRFVDKHEYLLSNPCPWNKVVKSTWYINNELKFPTGIWYEDRAVVGSYIKYCEKILFLSDELYYYRQRENSTMNQLSYSTKMLDIIEATKIMCTSINDKEYEAELTYISISSLIYQSAFRLIPLKRFHELSACVDAYEKMNQHWKHNLYVNKRSVFFKCFCTIVLKKHYKIASLMYKIQKRVSKL